MAGRRQAGAALVSPAGPTAKRSGKGSGGAGSARGGDGIERYLEMLEDVTVSLITERRDSQPWGLAG